MNEVNPPFMEGLKEEYLYKPFPKQLLFHNSTALNRLFGGAA